jgi:hypothetical protein
MDILNSITLSEFPLKLIYLLDLIYFEGPLLSIFLNEHQEFYLYYWSGVDSICHRWLVSRVSKQSLNKHINGELSLHDLVINPIDGFHYVIDINNDIEIINTQWLLPKYLPDSYISEEDSYFDTSLMNPESGENDLRLLNSLLK